ncbi:MAG: FeoA family protein [Candidatus Heimdallarchaeaceae archaeon]
MGATNTRITLDKLLKGKQGTIVEINANRALKRRLLDMGLTRGTSIQVVHTAPLGDPIEIIVKGYRLTLRKKEAATITIALKKRFKD